MQSITKFYDAPLVLFSLRPPPHSPPAAITEILPIALSPEFSLPATTPPGDNNRAGRAKRDEQPHRRSPPPSNLRETVPRYGLASCSFR